MTASTQPDPRASRRGQALDGGRLLAGLGALALLVSLFIDWYGTPDAPPGEFSLEFDAGLTAWGAFELVDILLAALALATIAWAIEGIARPNKARIPDALGIVAGPVALVLIVVSIIDDPPLVANFGTELEAGVWVALAGAVVMTIGALLRFARISISVSPRERAGADGATAAEPTAREPRYTETETRPLSEERRRPPR